MTWKEQQKFRWWKLAKFLSAFSQPKFFKGWFQENFLMFLISNFCLQLHFILNFLDNLLLYLVILCVDKEALHPDTQVCWHLRHLVTTWHSCPLVTLAPDHSQLLSAHLLLQQCYPGVGGVGVTLATQQQQQQCHVAHGHHHVIMSLSS